MKLRDNEVNFEIKFDDHKTPQNIHQISFNGVLMRFICEVKFDLIMSKPHYGKVLDKIFSCQNGLH